MAAGSSEARRCWPLAPHGTVPHDSSTATCRLRVHGVSVAARLAHLVCAVHCQSTSASPLTAGARADAVKRLPLVLLVASMGRRIRRTTLAGTSSSIAACSAARGPPEQLS